MARTSNVKKTVVKKVLDIIRKHDMMSECVTTFYHNKKHKKYCVLNERCYLKSSNISDFIYENYDVLKDNALMFCENLFNSQRLHLYIGMDSIFKETYGEKLLKLDAELREKVLYKK